MIMTFLGITTGLFMIYLFITIVCRFAPAEWTWYKRVGMCVLMALSWPIVAAVVPLILIIGIFGDH